MEHLHSKTSDDTLFNYGDANLVNKTYQAVLPNNDGTHERSHTEDVVSLPSRTEVLTDM